MAVPDMEDQGRSYKIMFVCRDVGTCFASVRRCPLQVDEVFKVLAEAETLEQADANLTTNSRKADRVYIRDAAGEELNPSTLVPRASALLANLKFDWKPPYGIIDPHRWGHRWPVEYGIRILSRA